MAFSLTFSELDCYSAVTNPDDFVNKLDAAISRKRKEREERVTELKGLTQELRVLEKAAKVIADLRITNERLTYSNLSLEAELDDVMQEKLGKECPAEEKKEHVEASAASECAVRN